MIPLTWCLALGCTASLALIVFAQARSLTALRVRVLDVEAELARRAEPERQKRAAKLAEVAELYRDRAKALPADECNGLAQILLEKADEIESAMWRC